jgi:DNA-binding transcriptional MocR family regulator
MQQAISLIARCLLLPQDSVVIDYPGYVGALQAFRLTGANVVGWDITQADITELETLLLTKRPKLLFVHPSFQNPTGRTLSLATRQAVVELAKAYRVPVVEDTTYGDLYFETPPPISLRDLAGDSLVIQLHTFSKTLAPGLRLGYIVADETIIDQLALVKAQSDLHSPTLSQWIITDILASGLFDKHIALLRHIHARRAEVLQRALRRQLSDAITWPTPNGGMYLWCSLSPALAGGSRSLLVAAKAEGVTFTLGENFFADGSGKRAFRLCFSAVPEVKIEEGVDRLRAAVHSCLTST